MSLDIQSSEWYFVTLKKQRGVTYVFKKWLKFVTFHFRFFFLGEGGWFEGDRPPEWVSVTGGTRSQELLFHLGQ